MSRSIGRLHVLTNYKLQQRYSHADLAKLAIHGGADTIQFRQKWGGVQHMLHAARAVASCCKARNVPLIINDRLDIQLATGADGVHLGQRDFPLPAAREVVGDEVIIGATATRVDEAIRAEEQGADYIGFGPVFHSNTKINPASVKGLRLLRMVCDSVSIPVIAISGITPERVAPVMETGAHGIAVLSGVVLADDPTAATYHYRKAIDEAAQVAS